MKKIMTAIEYTNHWLQGEIIEGRWIMAFGVLTAVLGLINIIYGSSANSRALILPTFVVAALMIAVGYGMSFGNMPRINQFAESYMQSPDNFLQSEIDRVDGFVKMYKWSPIICSILFLVGASVLVIFNKPWIRSWALAIMYIAFVLTVTDYFSKENGERYQRQLYELKSQNGV